MASKRVRSAWWCGVEFGGLGPNDDRSVKYVPPKQHKPQTQHRKTHQVLAHARGQRRLADAGLAPHRDAAVPLRHGREEGHHLLDHHVAPDEGHGGRVARVGDGWRGLVDEGAGLRVREDGQVVVPALGQQQELLAVLCA